MKSINIAYIRDPKGVSNHQTSFTQENFIIEMK